MWAALPVSMASPRRLKGDVSVVESSLPAADCCVALGAAVLSDPAVPLVADGSAAGGTLEGGMVWTESLAVAAIAPDDAAAVSVEEVAAGAAGSREVCLRRGSAEGAASRGLEARRAAAAAERLGVGVEFIGRERVGGDCAGAYRKVFGELFAGGGVRTGEGLSMAFGAWSRRPFELRRAGRLSSLCIVLVEQCTVYVVATEHGTGSEGFDRSWRWKTRRFAV